MDAPRRLTITRLGTAPPYFQGSRPTYIEARGRVSRGCSVVEVTVRLDPGGVALWPPRRVLPALRPIPPGEDADAPEHDAIWTCVFAFDPRGEAFGMIRCGVPLYVEARCVGGGAPCHAAARFRLRCEGAPTDPMAPMGPGAGRGGHPGHDPQNVFGAVLKRVSGATLLGASILLVGAACTPAVPLVAACAALAAAAAAFAVWRFRCVPDPCMVWGVVCWALKNAVVVGAALSLVTRSATGAVVTAIYGGLVSLAIAMLDRYRCPVPGIGSPPF